MHRALFCVFIVALAGCASDVIMLKNHATGQIVRCEDIESGNLPWPYGKTNSAKDCAKAYEAQGFKRIEQPKKP